MLTTAVIAVLVFVAVVGLLATVAGHRRARAGQALDRHLQNMARIGPIQ